VTDPDGTTNTDSTNGGEGTGPSDAPAPGDAGARVPETGAPETGAPEPDPGAAPAPAGDATPGPEVTAGGGPERQPVSGSGSPAEGGAPKPDGPYRRETKLPQNPRRVRGGVRMKRKEGDPDAWAEQRLWRICERSADGESIKEGLEYARGGQTRRITFVDGKAEASVQGRRTRAYTTVVTLPSYSHEQAAQVIQALGDQARYAAKLLAGELPPSIEDVFVPIGLHLFPANEEDIEVSCSCKEENQPWCKHAVCVTALLGERLAGDPFLVFELRGIPRDHLVEGLRDVRAMTTLGPGPQPVYSAHVSGLSDTPAASLEEVLLGFWRAPTRGEMPSVPVEPPEVSHPLLRRLGPSPFQESRFPLVGLLATCYDLIGRDALETDDPADDAEDGVPDGTPPAPEPDEEATPAPEAAPSEPERPRARARATARPLKRD
jgi:uncharacterized Zn finger protein